MNLMERAEKMYDKREFLSALLPQALNYDYGNITDMPKYEEIAGALGYARLSRGADLLMKVKYLYRDKYEPDFWSHTLIKIALPAAMKQNWPAGMLNSIVKAAINEVVADRLVCPKCDGKGHIVEDDKAIACDTCGTLGWIGFSDDKIARQMKMDTDVYRAIWKARYKYILESLRKYDEEIVKALNKHWL